MIIWGIAFLSAPLLEKVEKVERAAPLQKGGCQKQCTIGAVQQIVTITVVTITSVPEHMRVLTNDLGKS